MDGKLNVPGINSYSKIFSRKFCDDFFLSREVLTGAEIKSLTPIRAVNLFVIRQVLSKWQGQNEKLRSPYFDYNNLEVQKALKEFMNILSRHIAIDKNDFMPFLEKAVKDAILLIFSPYDFYISLIEGVESKMIELNWLKEQARYICINQSFVDALIKHFEASSLTQVSKKEGHSMMSKVFENLQATPDDFEQQLLDFNRILPFTLFTVYHLEKAPANKKKEKITTITPEESVNSALTTRKSQTINDSRRAKDGVSTLAGKLQKSRIDSIKNQISINQKFMFIKELFKGNDKDFHEAINTLEQQVSFEEAQKFIASKYAFKYAWDLKSEAVEEFNELLQKRFPR